MGFLSLPGAEYAAEPAWKLQARACLSRSRVERRLPFRQRRSAYGSEKLFDRPTAHDGASGLHVVVQPSGLVILTLKK